MKKTKVVGFRVDRMRQKMMAYAVAEQTDRLIEYAETTIQGIGDRIQEYHSLNHMDRTGNLLDSLCWGVAYKGELKASGFYREQQASRESYLHEWFNSDISSMFPIYGHGLAQSFIEEEGGKSNSGWRVFFAILAPYWGYWEKGFTMRTRPSSYDEDDAVHIRTLRFSVMTEFYDRVKRDLKPAKVTFRVNPPKYNTNNRNNLQRMRKRYSDNPYAEERWMRRWPKFKKRK